jgi:hypothetical protein
LKAATGATDDVAKAFDEFNEARAKSEKEIEELTKKEKELLAAREQANDPDLVKEYNKQLDEVAERMKEVQKETEAAASKFAEAVGKAKEAGGAFAGAASEVVDFGGALEAATGGFAPLLTAAKQFGALVPSFGKAEQGANLFSRGLQGVKAAIAASGIGALVLVLGSVVSYFTQTREGANRLSAVMRGLSEAFGQIGNKVQEFGKNIVDALSSPQKLIKDIGEAIQTNIMNRFAAFGKLAKAVAEGSFSAIGDAALQLITGVENVTGKVGKFIDGIKELGGQMVDTFNQASAAQAALLKLQQETLPEIEKQVVKLKEQGELQQKLAEDATRSFEERAAAAKEAERIQAEAFDKELAGLKEKLRLTQILNSFTDTSAEALAEQNELEKQILEKEKEKRLLLADIQKLQREIAAEAEAAEAARILAITTFNAELEKQRDELLKGGEVLDEFAARAAEAQRKALESVAKAEEQFAALQFKTAEERAEAEKALADYRVAVEQSKNRELEKIEQERLAALEAAEAEARARAREAAIADMENRHAIEQAELRRALAENVLTREEYEIRALEIQRRLLNERLAFVEKGSKEEAEIFAELAETKTEIEKKEAEKRQKLLAAVQEKSIETLQKGMQVASQIASALADKEIAEAERKRDATLAALDEQLSKGLITQEQYEAARADAEEQASKRIADEKKKVAELEKAFAIVNATIQGGLAVLAAFTQGNLVGGPIVGAIFAAIAGAFAAAQIGLIAAQPIPEFAKGVIDLKGPGTETSDSIVARLSKGESVMTAEETRAFKPTLRAIRAGAVSPEALNAFATGRAAADKRSVALLEKIEKAIREKETVALTVDEAGFRVFSYNELKKVEWMNKRYG